MLCQMNSDCSCSGVWNQRASTPPLSPVHRSRALQLDAPRTDCPVSLPAPANAPTAADLAVEADTPLNDHHLDSLDLLCALTHPRSAALHPVCSAAASTAAAGSAAGYAHLHAPTARSLRQRDFEGVSKVLFAAYRAQVAAASVATSAASAQ
jgi:hypothetical protein